MIEVEGLTKQFGQKVAIDNVTFRVEKGEILGFLGPNAAGKTTTMRILTCFFPATSGKARVAGFDVFSESLEVRKRIGYLPETVPLYREMRVNEYLDFVAAVKGVPRRERAKKISEVAHECAITDVGRQVIKSLSKGYRQRVGLAQALLHDPEVLILDEPTVGLDPRQIIEIRQLIKNLAGKRTIILSTHILPEVSMTCERVIIINKGKIVAQGTPEALTGQLQRSATVELEVDGDGGNVEHALSMVNGVTRVQKQSGTRSGVNIFTVETKKDKDVRRDLAAVVVNKGWGLLGMRNVSMTLEDIFVELVTREEAV